MVIISDSTVYSHESWLSLASMCIKIIIITVPPKILQFSKLLTLQEHTVSLFQSSQQDLLSPLFVVGNGVFLGWLSATPDQVYTSHQVTTCRNPSQETSLINGLQTWYDCKIHEFFGFLGGKPFFFYMESSFPTSIFGRLHGVLYLSG